MPFNRIENSSSKQQVARNLVPDLPDQNRGHNRGYESDSNLGVSEFGFWNRESEVAHGGKTGSSGNGRSVDRRDCWFRKFIKPAENLRHPSRISDVFSV